MPASHTGADSKVMAILFPIQLPAHSKGKAVEDGPGAETLASMWETQKVLPGTS